MYLRTELVTEWNTRKLYAFVETAIGYTSKEYHKILRLWLPLKNKGNYVLLKILVIFLRSTEGSKILSVITFRH